MRWLTGAGVIVVALAGAAEAQQRPGASYPAPGSPPVIHAGPQRMMPPVRGYSRGNRWPSRDGRWAAGWNAPGGWDAYRRPYAGWALPVYWTQPGFLVSDWADYGLAPPPAGRRWTRYYDDAVLVDSRGSVFDTVEDVDWDGVDYASAPPAPPPPPPPPRRTDDGLGGAAIGAVAGGVAGNVIAGRGNRAAGTLVGAGVGAAAGYAIDKAEDRRSRRRGYGAGYPPPPPYRYRGDDYRDDHYRGGHYGGDHWVSPDGRTTVTTSGAYGGTTTTVVVQNAPAVTTTTTEYYDDAVTYSPARKVYRQRTWRPKTKLMRRY